MIIRDWSYPTDEDEGTCYKVTLFDQPTERSSLVLDTDGEPFVLKTKKNPIGFDLKPRSK